MMRINYWMNCLQIVVENFFSNESYVYVWTVLKFLQLRAGFVHTQFGRLVRLLRFLGTVVDEEVLYCFVENLEKITILAFRSWKMLSFCLSRRRFRDFFKIFRCFNRLAIGRIGGVRFRNVSSRNALSTSSVLRKIGRWADSNLGWDLPWGLSLRIPVHRIVRDARPQVA